MRFLASLLLLSLMIGIASAQDSLPPLPGATEIDIADYDPLPAPIPLSAPSQEVLAYSVVIENRTGGMIRVIEPPAQYLLIRPGEDIGQVIKPASSLASPVGGMVDGARPGSVLASGVYGIELAAQAWGGLETGVLTLLPSFNIVTSDGHVAVPPLAGPHELQTDITPGYGLFGGGFPLLAGNPVHIFRDGAPAELEGPEARLETGDLIVIKVMTPRDWPQAVRIINLPGGTVDLISHEGERLVRGYVERPFGALDVTLRQIPAGVLLNAAAGQVVLTGKGEADNALVAFHANDALLPGEEETRGGVITSWQGMPASGMAPLFEGYLYAYGGLEAPRLLPYLELTAQFAGDGSWHLLSGLAAGTDYGKLDGVRIRWITHEPVPISAGGLTESEPPPPLTPREVAPPPSDLPSFRR